MIQLTDVSIEGIKEYRRREREIGCSWQRMLSGQKARYSHYLEWNRGVSQSFDHRMVLNWTWDTVSLKSRKWEDK